MARGGGGRGSFVIISWGGIKIVMPSSPTRPDPIPTSNRSQILFGKKAGFLFLFFYNDFFKRTFCAVCLGLTRLDSISSLARHD